MEEDDSKLPCESAMMRQLRISKSYNVYICRFVDEIMHSLPQSCSVGNPYTLECYCYLRYVPPLSFCRIMN